MFNTRILFSVAFALLLSTIMVQAQSTSHTPFGGNTTYHSSGGQTGTSHTPFGGNTTYHTFGGRSGTSYTPFGGNTTYNSGDLFREGCR